MGFLLSNVFGLEKGARFFFYIYDVIKIFFTIRITSDNRSSPKSIFPIIPPLSLHTGIIKCTVV